MKVRRSIVAQRFSAYFENTVCKSDQGRAENGHVVMSGPTIFYMNTYFITGATGVLGSAIVKELLSNPENRLVLLVRAENELVLQKRITELLSFLGVGEKTRDRMDFIRGDVELERFGLHPGNFIKLGDQVTHIIHSAASVRMNYSLEQARLAAVTATEHVLQLARLSRKMDYSRKWRQ